MKSIDQLFATLVLVAGLVAGCGGEQLSDGSSLEQPLTVVPGDLQRGNEPLAPPSAAPEGILLEFVMQVGSDGLPCASTCAVYMGYDDTITLGVRVSRDQLPLEGEVITFSVQDETAPGLGQISALSAFSDADGLAEITAEAARTAIGSFHVRAHGGDSASPDLLFDVVVTPDSLVPLTVTTTYEGDRPVSSYRVDLVVQDESGQPDCGDLLGLSEIAADVSSESTPMGLSTPFPYLPGLGDVATAYTVLVAASDGGDVPVVRAWGCDDHRANLAAGSQALVDVVLEDRPVTLAGSYQLTTALDVAALTPAPYSGPKAALEVFLASPPTELMEITCQWATDVPSLGDLCDLIYGHGDGFNVSEKGAEVLTILNDQMMEMAIDTPWSGVLLQDYDALDGLQNVSFEGSVAWTAGPGTGEEVSGLMVWESLAVTAGVPGACGPEADSDCVSDVLYVGSLLGSGVSGALEGSATDGLLEIAPAALGLKHGALLGALMEEALLPFLTGDGTTSWGEIASFKILLATMLGGEGCEGDGLATCCASFVTSMGDGSDLLTDEDLEVLSAACEPLITFGDQSLGSTFVTSSPMPSMDSWSVETAGACPLVDGDGDLVADGLGTPEEPCTWIVQVGFPPGPSFQASFWATRK